MASTDVQEKIDWNAVVQQIYDEIGSDIAIVDKYGMVMASRVRGVEKGRLISPLFWSVIQNRQKLADELDVTSVSSFVLETDQGYMVFVFGDYIYLMSIIPASVNLTEVLPSWKTLMKLFDKSEEKDIKIAFQKLELDEEFKKLFHEGEQKMDNFPVFPSLITHLAKKKK